MSLFSSFAMGGEEDPYNFETASGPTKYGTGKYGRGSYGDEDDEDDEYGGYGGSSYQKKSTVSSDLRVWRM